MADVPDPFKPPDATVMRPRPGAGRRGDPVARHAPVPEPADLGPALAMPASVAPGRNPLVQAASPLLMLAGHLRGTRSAPDVGGLRRQALDEIRRFEERARQFGVANQSVVAARYVLCAGLDEAVLSTPWGMQSEWAQQTLLVALHREAFGGEKFFEMLERLAQDPQGHLDLMELQYLCLAFGFAGKYQMDDRGHGHLAEIKQRIYRQIRDQRGASPAELSLKWRGREDRRNPIIRYVPWWVVGAAALALLAVTFVFYQVRLGRAAAAVETELSRIGAADALPAPPMNAAAATLRERLRRLNVPTMTVRDEGGRTRIVLVELFDSGRIDVRSGFDEVLRQIGEILKQVPGQVTVVGHTDSQPVRSVTYGNNGELSRLRAERVAAILRGSLGPRAHLESRGAGDSEELPGSAKSDPANRRVEIIHDVRDGGY